MRPRWLAALLVASCSVVPGDLSCCFSAAAGPAPGAARRSGRVRVSDHTLVDDGGPFLGLGVSYFTALRRCKSAMADLPSGSVTDDPAAKALYEFLGKALSE